MRRTSSSRHKQKLFRDISLVVLSIVAAIALKHWGFFDYVASLQTGNRFVESFIYGMFFTSAFTTPISIIAFTNIADTANLLVMSWWGACGAVLGDLILFFFIRDTLAEDISYMLQVSKAKQILAIFHRRMFRWFTPLVGAIILASPLPDELGIAIMGFSKVRTSVLIPVSFVMNFIGIFIIGLIAVMTRG